MDHEIGIIGLGRMGGGLAWQAAGKDIRVVGFDPSGLTDELKDAGVELAESLEDLSRKLSPRRVIFVYVPAGGLIDQILDDVAAHLEPGDVVVDGGNSYWGDSIRRGKRLAEQGIELVDCGTSGGVSGAREGACFMIGGSNTAVAAVEPLLTRLAVEGGYVHAGPVGSGHFTKLVHNGIEFGMLQAIAEGVDLLEHYHESLPVPDVLRCWRHGSVIRSWLIDLMEQHMRERDGLGDIPSFIEDTGEVNWLVSDAMQMERPVPVIAQSVNQLFASRDDDKTWAKAIAAMRHGFGGHPFGPAEPIAKERRKGRVGPIFRPDES